MKSGSRPPIIFINSGWMNRYQGPLKTDPTRGNFGYLKKKTHGHECFNFKPKSGICFGHHPGNPKTVIDKLGASKDDEYIDGVLVIWMARDYRFNKTRIVGWYWNARVYRDYQKPKRGEGHKLHNAPIMYKVRAKARNCHLLPPNQRLFHIPTSKEKKGGFGQSPFWYGFNNTYLNKVWRYVQDPRPETSRKSSKRKLTKPPRNHDPEYRQKVEQFAINHATAHYESYIGGNRNVISVELKRKGWDLEAKGDDGTLLVEVKGLSGSSVIAELTPNEFAKMRSANLRKQYVLYVVTNCLKSEAQSHIFRYMHDSKRWETEKGRVLEIKVKPGAVVSCK